MKKFDVKDPKLAEAGKKKIEWAGSQMKVLAKLKDRFEKEKPLKGINLAACLHVTAETANLVIALKAGGAKVALCASNPLSTQDDVAASLAKDYEIATFALYPLFVIWVGKTSAVTIFILIIEMIWPILFTILSAHKQIREDLIEAATSFGATGPKFLIYILAPLLFPAIVTGSIVAWGEAWEAIIAAEIIVAVPGVGSYLASLGTVGQAPTLIIGIILLLTILFILNKYIWLPLLNVSTKYQQE